MKNIFNVKIFQSLRLENSWLWLVWWRKCITTKSGQKTKMYLISIWARRHLHNNLKCQNVSLMFIKCFVSICYSSTLGKLECSWNVVGCSWLGIGKPLRHISKVEGCYDINLLFMWLLVYISWLLWIDIVCRVTYTKEQQKNCFILFYFIF